MLDDFTPELFGQVSSDVVIRSRAPLRISFCGGGTDLMPYAEQRGGLVLSATIRRYAYATLQFHSDPEIRVNSLDYGSIARYSVDEPLIYDGKFDLVKACLRRLRLGPDAERAGLDLHLETDAPPGSGLGASSALVVSMIGAFQAWRRLSLSRYDIAHLAYVLERKDVGIAGGMQDQYAAAFGGFNLIEFNGERDVIVNPLRIDAPIVNELEYCSLLVFTGATRLSSRIIDAQVRGYEAGTPEVVDAFSHMKALAIDAKAALLRGQILELGEILHEQWLHKKSTSSAISNPHIDRLYDAARDAGAVGGKMNGAGGGGFMYLVCPFDRKQAVTSRLTELGAEVSPVAFEFDGVQSWLTNPRERSARMAVAAG